MDSHFRVDPGTDLPLVFDHGVTEEEVRHLLSRKGEELPGSDRSQIRLGQTDAGRRRKEEGTNIGAPPA